MPESKASDSSSVAIVRQLGPAFDRLRDRIRHRAYQLFLDRADGRSDPEADWLAAESEFMMPVPVVFREHRKHLVLEADLKGFSREDIEVQVEDGNLAIFGTHRETLPGGKGKKAREQASVESVVGFYRSVPLPGGIDPGGIHAKLFKNGKLKITLPKNAQAS